MKKIMPFIVLMLIVHQCYAQLNDKSVSFLKQVLPNRVPIYRQEMGVLKQDYIDRYFSSVASPTNVKKGKPSYEHVIQFTAKEKQYIRSEFTRMHDGFWSKELFPSSKMLSKDSISRILNNGQGRNYFEKNYGSRIYSFTKPIFLRRDKFVLFYVEYDCGDRCGEGSLAVYQQKDSYWVPVATISNWIS